MFCKFCSNIFTKLSKEIVSLPVLFLLLFLVVINFYSVAQCSFKTIGHRGGSSCNYPENTLVSLEQGFIEDIYAAEVDVRFTSDSILVLMHDYYIDRTTNGTGNIEELTLEYIKSLDAGRWKDSMFAGTKVPTLEEALLLAQQYDKKLYLNMKVFVPDLIAKVLIQTGVDEDIILLDPDDLEKVKEYHSVLPNTPLVYFGAFPEEDELTVFFAELKENGVLAIEIPADYIYNEQGNEYEEMRDLAQQYGIEFWAYTVNDKDYFQFLKDFGIDALETDRPSAARQFFCENGSGGFFPKKQITGHWDFNYSLQGTIGSQLVYLGDTTVENQKIQFGTTESFGLPSIDNENVNVVRIPAFDENHALQFFSNIAPEGLPGGLDCDNTYTIIFDLLKPKGNDSYTAIFQTSNQNSDDADFFLFGDSNSFGVVEQYTSGFDDSTWVRLALVFDLYNEKLDEYVNGDYVGTVILEDSQNGRFCLNNNWGVQASHFFSDNDGETNPVFVSSIQLRNYVMSSEEISDLGEPKAEKISRVILSDTDIDCPEFVSDIAANIEGNSVELFAEAGDNVNYKWEINTGDGWENITGVQFKNTATNKLSILYADETMNGYRFRCIASNNCQTYSNEFILDGIQTGINSTLTQNLFSVFPNPSSGEITIMFKEDLRHHTIIQVFTSLGSMIIQEESELEEMNLNLTPGSYYVRAFNNFYSETKKLIICK